MKMNLVIQKRRKVLGLTQEQVAEYLGVTAPAVNKWEKGSTCPDISLLPPLARLLRIDLNTLFGFYEEVTREELIAFCREIRELTETDGLEAGFVRARELLREHPNSDTLLYNLALQIQGLLPVSGLSGEQAETYMEAVAGWYEQLVQSQDAVIRNGAHFMLASRAISHGRYEEGQRHLDRLPNRSDTPDKRMLQAAIDFNQGRAEEAAKQMEGALLAAVGDVQMVLCKLVDANLAVGDRERALYAAERLTRLAETFDLSPYNAAVASFQMALADRDADRVAALLRRMLESLSAGWQMHASPLYRRVTENHTGAPGAGMIGPLLKAMRQDPAYDWLRESEAFRNLMTEWE